MSDIELAMSTYRRACGKPADADGIAAVWALAYQCCREDAARAETRAARLHGEYWAAVDGEGGADG